MVTVPAYFNDAQRQSTKDAGTISGMNVLLGGDVLLFVISDGDTKPHAQHPANDTQVHVFELIHSWFSSLVKTCNTNPLPGCVSSTNPRQLPLPMAWIRRPRRTFWSTTWEEAVTSSFGIKHACIVYSIALHMGGIRRHQCSAFKCPTLVVEICIHHLPHRRHL